jgi:hypothetical protein
MSNYSELLRDPRWQKKRLKILERDDWKCTECSRKDLELHVHHKSYEYGKDPWDYDDSVIVTMCLSCHGLEELLKKVNPDFYRLAKAGNLTCMWLYKCCAAFSYSSVKLSNHQEVVDFVKASIVTPNLDDWTKFMQRAYNG